MLYPKSQPKSSNQVEISRIAPAGDQALVVEFPARIARDINAGVRSLEEAIRQSGWPEIVATVPSYCSLLVYFDPIGVSFEELSRRIHELSRSKSETRTQVRRWKLPVCYGGDYGADLDPLSAALGISSEEIVRIHSAVEYMVYMIGFSPGFAYLGELPSALGIPRKAALTPEIPANTVQIGGQQTALSSMPMPSGWYIIGRTPVPMYQPARKAPFLLDGGDLVAFQPIASADFVDISARIDRGEFEPSWSWA